VITHYYCKYRIQSCLVDVACLTGDEVEFLIITSAELAKIGLTAVLDMYLSKKHGTRTLADVNTHDELTFTKLVSSTSYSNNLRYKEWLDGYAAKVGPICECGSDSCGSPRHSIWCGKFEI